MITFRKMVKQDVPVLYEMALRAFQPDFEKYGVYPPLLKTEKKSFLPPLIFGKVVLADGIEIGGVFVVTMGKKGELGSIFIDPAYQRKGYGKQVISAIEEQYPKVQRWKLDTPSENYHLHRFYESMGFVKTGEMKDPKSEMVGFIYENTI